MPVSAWYGNQIVTINGDRTVVYGDNLSRGKWFAYPVGDDVMYTIVWSGTGERIDSLDLSYDGERLLVTNDTTPFTGFYFVAKRIE